MKCAIVSQGRMEQFQTPLLGPIERIALLVDEMDCEDVTVRVGCLATALFSV